MNILPHKSNGPSMFCIAKISQLKTAIDRHFNKYLEFASFVSFLSLNRDADQHLSCNSV